MAVTGQTAGTRPDPDSIVSIRMTLFDAADRDAATAAIAHLSRAAEGDA